MEFLNKIINVLDRVNSFKNSVEKNNQSWLKRPLIFFKQRSIRDYNEIKAFYLF